MVQTTSWFRSEVTDNDVKHELCIMIDICRINREIGINRNNRILKSTRLYSAKLFKDRPPTADDELQEVMKLISSRKMEVDEYIGKIKTLIKVSGSYERTYKIEFEASEGN